MPTESRLIIFLLLAACGGGSDSTSRTVTLGDTIVHTAGEPERFGELVVETTIGLVDGPEAYLFGRLGDAAFGPEGQVWVLDTQADDVREFTSDGTFVRRIGRKGGGPGEYDLPRMLAVTPDGRVLVGDTRGDRIHVYASDGEYITTWDVNAPIEWPLVAGRNAFVHVRSGGAVPFANRVDDAAIREAGVPILFVRVFTRSVVPDIRPARTVRLRASDGAVLDTVQATPLPDMDMWAEPPGGGRIYIGLPYYPFGWWRWTPQGSLLSGTTDRYAIDIRRPPAPDSGTRQPRNPVIRIQRPVTPPHLTTGEQSALAGVFVGNMASAEWHSPLEETPLSKPAYRHVIPSNDGRLWVRLHVPSSEIRFEVEGEEVIEWREESSLFDVWELDGDYVGQVRGPGGLRIRAIDGDRVVAFTTDGLDVPKVVVYRVQWD